MAVHPSERIGVPSFSSIEAAQDALRAKTEHLPADLYLRDGTRALARLEAHVGELMGIEGQNVILYGTGMSAVVDALEVKNPDHNTTVLFGEQSYSKIQVYGETALRPRGVRVAIVDVGSVQDVRRAIERCDPDIIFFETVTNGPDMPVLDTEGLFSIIAERKKKPLVILDNTLATPTELPLARRITTLDFPVIVVESGTKFYGLNQEMLGIGTTNDRSLSKMLRDRRQMVGSLLSNSSVKILEGIILPSREEFDRRNKKIFANTHALAKTCAQVGEATGRFIVSYPNLPSHPNTELANALSPEGIAPLFFIQSQGYGEDDQLVIARTLWENPVIREFCELGQSFGFEKTRIWFDPVYMSVRVSGGTESAERMDMLKAAFQESLASLR